MNAATLHRGPDHSGFQLFQFKQQQIFIGTNRLKIIDTDDQANQPFMTADKRFVISYNGALYNFQELKNELNGVEWRTHSDTEVLLHWLIQNGERGLTKLNGMFAFGFYDRQQHKLLLARDPSGIKPLYYYNDERYFIASSELKGILASGLVTKEFNHTQVDHYLRYKYIPKPFTFYKNIFELNEASYLMIDEKDFKIRRYEMPSVIKHKSYNDDALLLKADVLLNKAVERHLISDVPTGLYLSGGIDSTLLLSKIQQLGYTRFPTFTITNTEQEKTFGTEDYHFARLAAKKFNSDHHEIAIDGGMLSQLPEFINLIDQPVGDSAIFLTHYISQEAGKTIRVALNGAGADELFAGYNRHMAYRSYLRHLLHRKLAIQLLKNTYKVLPDGGNHSLRKVFRLWNKFTGMLDVDPIATYHNFTSSEYFISRNIDNQELTEELEEKSYEDESYYLYYGLRNDRTKYLISDVLALTDKMTMRSSIEARVPFLDQELRQFTESLDPSILLKHGRKWILKELLRKSGGEEFLKRPKEGFGMPFGHWLKEARNRHLVEQLLNKKHPVYEWVPYTKIEQLIQIHLSNKRDCTSELWSVLLLMGWYEKEF